MSTSSKIQVKDEIIVDDFSVSNGSQIKNEVTSQSIQVAREPQCYCGEPRDFSHADFQCSVCYRWFHQRCIKFNVGAVKPFMTNYHFMCKKCNAQKPEEVFNRKQANFAVMCHTALANLHWLRGSVDFLSVEADLIPFLEVHWESLASQPRRSNKAWHVSIAKCVAAGEQFRSQRDKDDQLLVCLANSDLSKIAPNYDQFRALASGLKTDISKLNVQVPGRTKRKAPGEAGGLRNRKAGEERVKLNFAGYPIEHPFNKDNYRYILAETDPNAPGREQWDDTEYGAGKPIPGLLYRIYLSPQVLLSMNDRAHQLKITPNQMQITGDKGYAMVRATHGVVRDTWYYEVNVVDMAEGTAARIGWALAVANLQAPTGYDRFSYAWRSRHGTRFHQSRGQHYSERGFRHGDVIGCLIQLPRDATSVCLPATYKSRPLIKFKNALYYEDRDEVEKFEKTLKPLVNSSIEFFRNGESQGIAFTNISAGVYYPSLSLYRNCVLSANFGPDFQFPPPLNRKARPMCERVEDMAVEQTLADTLENLDNVDKLDGVLQPNVG